MAVKSIFRQENRQNWGLIADNLKAKLLNDKEFLEGDWEIEPKPLKKKPTMNQRAYYFGVILPLIRSSAANQGMHYPNIDALDNDIKGIMRDQYSLYVETKNKLSGKSECRSISLSEIKGDKLLTSRYIDTVIMWAGEFFDLMIPYYEKKVKDGKKS